MKYKIFIYPEFKEDFNNAYDYINHKFKAKKASSNLRKSMQKCILNLGTIPESYLQLDDFEVANFPLRFCVCENFYILFTVVNKKVNIYNFVYSRSEKFRSKYISDES